MKLRLILGSLIFWAHALNAQQKVILDAPDTVSRYEIAEFVVRVNDPQFNNAFNAELTAVFDSGTDTVHVTGFSDSQDGSIFRLLFSPSKAPSSYQYVLKFNGEGLQQQFSGVLKSLSSDNNGPVIVDKDHPKHFVYEGSGEPFYHLGFTAYHLLDPSNDDAHVDATIDYCVRNGYNKIRFLLTGYARDNNDTALSKEDEHGGDNVTENHQQHLDEYNYGAIRGRVNHLPAWLGKPHEFDFSRFNISYWQRIERAVRRMKDYGIIANCIFTIEKQELPTELGALTENEIRLYRYAIARLASFNNVWWDLGNEHNETRDVAWGNTMGTLVKQADPYDRLTSAHAYDKFLYSDSPWADYIITQQYGNEQQVHDWTLRYLTVPKPYVNEEYGYEGNVDTVAHSQNRERTVRCHWAIAMAGGYGTYGDWSNYISYFYMGVPGPGKAAAELKYLRSFFEALPFREMKSQDKLTTHGFCLAQTGKNYVFYFPRGGMSEIDLSSFTAKRLHAYWYNPGDGNGVKARKFRIGKNKVNPPSKTDWVLHVSSESNFNKR